MVRMPYKAIAGLKAGEDARSRYIGRSPADTEIGMLHAPESLIVTEATMMEALEMWLNAHFGEKHIVEALYESADCEDCMVVEFNQTFPPAEED